VRRRYINILYSPTRRCAQRRKKEQDRAQEEEEVCVGTYLTIGLHMGEVESRAMCSSNEEGALFYT